MIEEIVREHLKTILDVPVLMEEENEEKKYILIEKTGGSEDRKSTRLNSSHSGESRMPSSA